MMGRVKKNTSTPTFIEDEFVPPSDEEQSEFEENSEEEEEDEEESCVGGYEPDESSKPSPPPPKTSVKMKIKYPTSSRAAAQFPPNKKAKNETELKKKSACVKEKTAATTSITEQGPPKMDKLKLKRKANSNDFEIQLEKNNKVTDMSVNTPKYPRDKILLDERHWMRISTVNYKSKGIMFDQVFIGRDPPKGDTSQKPFQMGLPIRCLESLQRGFSYLTSFNDVPKTV